MLLQVLTEEVEGAEERLRPSRLSGKPFGEVQLAITELDPTLDPCRVVGDFLARNVRDRLRRQADPEQLCCYDRSAAAGSRASRASGSAT